MTEDSFGISVVVPTRGRVKLLEHLLCSLNEAKAEFEYPVEVLIIDDSSVPAQQEIEELCQNYDARFLLGTSSVRAKRNLGIKEAHYTIILFVDSDCEATPNLFNEHIKVYQENDPRIAGCIGVTEFVGKKPWIWDVIERTQFLNAFSFAKRMDFAPWATCSNTSYRAEVLNQMQGFETSFPARLGGDDTDLGLRMNKAGYKLKCNPDAVVFHARETWGGFVPMWRRAFRWGRMDVHLYYRRHNDRVSLGLPKFGHIFLALLLTCCVIALINTSISPLVLPFIWGVSVVFIRAIGTVFITREPWRYLIHELLADILGLAFEFGMLLEGISHLELTVLYKTVKRGPVLPIFEQQEELVLAWSMWLGTVLILLLQGV